MATVQEPCPKCGKWMFVNQRDKHNCPGVEQKKKEA